jgi:hypothetical protein
MSFNIIGDIAGNFKTFQALIAKMPEGKIIAVGDIIDRGPCSKEVVDFFMQTEKDGNITLMGNHEHMMIDYHRQKSEYDPTIWLYNGGIATANSFKDQFPEEVIQFLETRKIDIKLEIDGKSYYISHTFKPSSRSIDEIDPELFRRLWNRQTPFFNSESPDFQIAGHNSQFGLRRWDNGNVDIYAEKEKHAICIDSSAKNILTGIHLPSMIIYQQEYIDE